MRTITKEWSLLDTKSKQHCCLREYFERLDGEFKTKEIDLRGFVESEVVDIEKRPQFTPILSVSKSKQLGEKEYYMFSENIYTNNPFLRRFEGFLRANAEEIEAEKFDYTPENYRKDWYKTPFTLIPVDGHEFGAVLHEPKEKPKLIFHKEIIYGVDFEGKPTLRMVKAKTIDQKLKEIEKESNFSAMILYIGKNFSKNFEEKTDALEVKHGNVHFAITKI